MFVGNKNDNNDDKLEARIRSTLRAQEAIWTPKCPTPETLMGWIEQADRHPQAAFLSAHFLTCAYCQEYHADLYAIRAMAEILKPSHADFDINAKISELITKGFLAPVASLLTAFEQMKPRTPVLVRSGETLHDLRPRFTAVRSPQPTLQWQGDAMAPEIEVVIAGPGGHVWKGYARAGQPFIVPETAGLEPGAVYQWQVIPHNGDNFEDDFEMETRPPAVGFVVLSESLAQQVTALEQEAGDSLMARLSVYEAHGLYEDALQALKKLPEADREETLTHLYEKLLQHLNLEAA